MKINYRRFGHQRLLFIQVSEFHTAIFPVRVNNFQVTNAKTGTAKPFRRPIASIRANRNPIEAAGQTVQRPPA